MKKVIMYEKIYRDIIKSIQEGIYKEKDLLPSEKELAEQYGVSRITTNKAMNMLARQGVIERIQGKGSFVSSNAMEMTQNVIEMEKFTEAEHVPERHSESAQNMIGVIVDGFDITWGSNLIKGIERECNKQNLGMFFCCTYGSVDAENEGIKNALTYGVRGLILMPVQGEKYNDTILKLALNKFPVVLVDRDMKGIGIPCVKTDNYAAAKELTEILISRGHKNICFVTHSVETTPTIENRVNAFRDCVMKHPDCRGVVELMNSYNTTLEDADQAYMDYDLSEVKAIIEREQDCTAFFTVEYKMGALFKRAFRELGMKREICTFDGLGVIYTEGEQFLHVRQGEYQIGKEAVKTLKNVMDGKETELIIDIPYMVVM